MLRVNVKGSGGQKRYKFEETIVISDDGELVGEDGVQSGRLLASAGKTMTVAEAEALGVATLLDCATKKVKAKPKTKSAPVASKAATKSRRKKDK
jgi:hypothetical protein